MNRISREFWFSAAHRIEGHPKCGRLHGHNYKVVVSVSGPLDKQGMVMDFAELDRIVKPVVDSFDHYTLFSFSNIRGDKEFYDLCSKRGWAVRVDIENSTAEELARLIHAKVWASMNVAPENIEVLVQETPRNDATFGFDKP